MTRRLYYRICEIKNGEFHSLFHGTGGSRKLPVGRWIEADKKMVRDGSGEKYYPSGFHVLPDYEAAVKFFNTHFRVKDNRCIVACYVEGLHRKEKSREEVWLAERIYLLREATVE